MTENKLALGVNEVGAVDLMDRQEWALTPANERHKLYVDLIRIQLSIFKRYYHRESSEEALIKMYFADISVHRLEDSPRSSVLVPDCHPPLPIESSIGRAGPDYPVHNHCYPNTL